MKLKLHTEHEVKMTKCFNINKKLLCFIYKYSVLSSNIRMNNFVSLRAQVLGGKSHCDSWFTLCFSTLLFFFICHTWQRLQLKLSSSCPRINSPNLFLRAVFVKFWSLKPCSTSTVWSGNSRQISANTSKLGEFWHMVLLYYSPDGEVTSWVLLNFHKVF